MTMFLAPYTAIADIDGSPLDAGFLFFGEYNKDPELFPVPVYWDADFTVPAAQPIRTRNGYPVRNGSPTKVYLKTAQHSIVIKNRNGAFILVDFKNKGWDASLVVDGDRTQKQINDNQKQINDNQAQINARTATPYDFGAIGDGVAHPLSERYASLADAKAVYPAATSLTEYIDGHALNAWWRDICANDRKFATCHGRFISNTKISNAGLNDPNNYIKTGHIDFAAYIGFGGLSDILENGFEIVSPRLMQFSGRLEIEDLNREWANRKVNNILYMEDLIHSKHTWKVICRNARKLGLQVYSERDDSLSGAYANNNTSDLGSWLFVACGHRFKHGDFAFNSVTDTGTAAWISLQDCFPSGPDVMMVRLACRRSSKEPL